MSASTGEMEQSTPSMPWLTCFRNFPRDRRAQEYCLRRPVWYMRPRFTSQTRLLARPLHSRHMLRSSLGDPLLARWRRSLEHRQAAIARPRKYSNREAPRCFSLRKASAPSSVRSIFAHENVAVARNDAMTPPSQLSREGNHLRRATSGVGAKAHACPNFLQNTIIQFFTITQILTNEIKSKSNLASR